MQLDVQRAQLDGDLVLTHRLLRDARRRGDAGARRHLVGEMVRRGKVHVRSPRLLLSYHPSRTHRTMDGRLLFDEPQYQRHPGGLMSTDSGWVEVFVVSPSEVAHVSDDALSWIVSYAAMSTDAMIASRQYLDGEDCRTECGVGLPPWHMVADVAKGRWRMMRGVRSPIKLCSRCEAIMRKRGFAKVWEE